MLQKNSILTLQVEDLNNLGFGVAHKDGLTVFIGGAVTGDTVVVRIILSRKSYAVGKLLEVIAPSPYRIEPACAASACGGCAYRAVSYAHEKECKYAYITHAFRKAGLADAIIEPVVSTEQTHGYRNKAQYALGQDQNGRCIAGFYAPKSHRLTEAANCPLQHPAFPPILHTLLDFFNRHRIPTYREESGEGLLRHVYLRAATDGRVLLTLVINGDRLPHADALIGELKEKHPNIVGCMLNINKEATNVICGKTYLSLYGKTVLTDTLCGVELELSPASFYQVNHDAAELLYQKAADLADLQGDELLLDLYCGVGSIGLSMAHMVKRLIGVEIVPSAVDCARRNAAQNGTRNADFFCADAGDPEALLSGVKEVYGSDFRPDVVILDPPRKGATPEVLTYIAEKLDRPKIVYISCDVDTLARDAALLVSLGYQMGQVTPYDLFPRTGHVENVVCFSCEKTVHQMNLHAEPFAAIKSGKKTIELRLWDEKRQTIKVGDTMVFTHRTTGEKLTATVVHLHRFAGFAELYRTLPLLQCGYTEETVKEASPSDMDAYYPAEKQEKYGVVGIELSLV